MFVSIIEYMLKRKPAKRQSYRSELKKLVHFQNETSLSFQINWINPTQSVCRTVDSQNYCFCGHFLSQHMCSRSQSIDKCTAQRCKCQHFYFVPDLNLKCICKHAPFRHEMDSKKCKQCVNCIGFVTDWLCQCGYRFEEHQTTIQMQKEGKNKVMGVSTSLPRLKNNKNPLNISYPNHDKVKESLSVSLVKLKVDNSFLKENNSPEHEHERYLKEKLRQANLRYFSRFKGFATQNSVHQDKEETDHEVNGLDLYIQPHNFRNFPLSKHITYMLANRQH